MAKKAKQAVKVWYKSTCKTCINAKAILTAAGYEPEYFEYMNAPLTEADLKTLIDLLGIAPEQLVRKKEPIYKELFAEKKMTRLQWIKAFVKYPQLIERPIVISGDKAFIGRPLERVEEFCKK